ncbi:hypothetical protein HK103_007280 [Boothiomyces macroporosus]|uniref:Ankyrin repeat protein n=1 Tax=Boothiomyces macroporosus TaxID=261099 RepID=A0AAD5UD57_9FUNG|nr:hypothetical protein HK103_007280 [Boothiomyces macroporosus]
MPNDLQGYITCNNWTDVVKLNKPFLLPWYNLATNRSPIQKGVFKVAVENKDLKSVIWFRKNADNSLSREGYDFYNWSRDISDHRNMFWLKDGKRWWEVDEEITHEELEEWKVKVDCPWDETTFATAIYYGRLDVAKWLYKNQCPFGIRLEYWVDVGVQPILEWLFEINFPFTRITIFEAVENGNYDLVSRLILFGVELESWLLTKAMYGQHREIVKLLLDNNCPIDDVEINSSVFQTNNLDFIQFLFDSGIPLGENPLEFASTCDLEILNWVYSKTPILTIETFQDYVGWGTLENMQWLKEKNCPWDSSAYWSTDLDKIKWLIDNNCPIDASVIANIVKRDNENVFTALQFMLSNDFPIDETAYCNAMAIEGTRILDLLYRYSPKLTVNVFKEAVLSDELEKVVWCVEHNCPFDESVYDGIGESTDSLAIKKYLSEIHSNIR